MCFAAYYNLFTLDPLATSTASMNTDLLHNRLFYKTHSSSPAKVKHHNEDLHQRTGPDLRQTNYFIAILCQGTLACSLSFEAHPLLFTNDCLFCSRSTISKLAKGPTSDTHDYKQNFPANHLGATPSTHLWQLLISWLSIQHLPNINTFNKNGLAPRPQNVLKRCYGRSSNEQQSGCTHGVQALYP